MCLPLDENFANFNSSDCIAPGWGSPEGGNQLLKIFMMVFYKCTHLKTLCFCFLDFKGTRMHNTHLEYFKKSECEKRVENIFIKTNESKVSKAFI